MSKISTLLFLIVAITTANAGEFASHGMMLGFNSSTFIGADKPKDVNRMLGLTLGGFVSYQFNPHLALQPEVTFTTKGARFPTIGDAEMTNIFAYLEIPVLIKYCFQTNGPLHPVVCTGPAVAFKYFALNDVGVLEDIRFVDVVLVVDAGLEFWKLACHLRYIHGLRRFDESECELDVKNSTISLNIGFSFCRKEK